MGIGIIKVSNEMIVKGLGLPLDSVIRGVNWNWGDDAILLKITSDKCPTVKEGDEIPIVTMGDLNRSDNDG